MVHVEAMQTDDQQTVRVVTRRHSQHGAAGPGHVPQHGAPGHNCLTGCAGTFRRAMRDRRVSRASVILNNISEHQAFEAESSDASMKEEDSDSNSSERSSVSPHIEIQPNRNKCNKVFTKTRKISLDTGRAPNLNLVNIANIIGDIQEQTTRIEKNDNDQKFNREKRKSSLAKIFSPQGPDLIEGQYALISSNNFEQYLEAIGTGPMSRTMVMRSKVQLNIGQTLDKQWQIFTETAIKAKSIRGYATYNRKLTQNKFKEGEPKPELLDDWDQRLVVTTLTREDQGCRLKLEQVAEKDQKFCRDSSVILSVDRDEPGVLVATFMLDSIIAWRKFRRMETQRNVNGRRHSVV